MANRARRIYVIRELVDPGSGESLGYDREEAAEVLADLEATLFRVGGMVNIATRRVQVGEAMGEPLAISAELVVTWDSFSPLERADDGPAEDAPAADADHPLVAEDVELEPEWPVVDEADDTRPASEIAAEFGEEPVSEATA